MENLGIGNDDIQGLVIEMSGSNEVEKKSFERGEAESSLWKLKLQHYDKNNAGLRNDDRSFQCLDT